MLVGWVELGICACEVLRELVCLFHPRTDRLIGMSGVAFLPFGCRCLLGISGDTRIFFLRMYRAVR